MAVSFDPVTDYPLGERRPDLVTTPSGLPLDQVTLEALRRGRLSPDDLRATAETLRRRYPGLPVVGTFAGSPRPEEAPAILARLRQARPDVLFVAYGAPRQDLWIARYQPDLQIPVAMGVGGAFDFLAGVVPRAPRWMREAGLEWLYRLLRQPWRWRRMRVLPRFVLDVLRARYGRGGTGARVG